MVTGQNLPFPFQLLLFGWAYQDQNLDVGIPSWCDNHPKILLNFRDRRTKVFFLLFHFFLRFMHVFGSHFFSTISRCHFTLIQL